MIKGYWVLVLHSHLPFVKHPEYDYFLEEHWLFEAISETYLPLLMNMKKLLNDGVDFRLTTSVTPPLAEMLADEYLISQYLKHMDKLIELTEKEIVRLKHDNEFLPVARFYNKKYCELKRFFVEELDCQVLNGYRYFSNLGKVEIITCGATHGFLPILSVNKRSVEVQLKVAVETHARHFGKAPNGIWLPECAFYEGLDDLLKKYGIKFFFMDTHGVNDGKPQPRYSVYAPVYTPSGIAVFARDLHSSQQVWSSVVGYPGDPYYRDFYRDLGYDLDFDYIKPYISPDGIRVFTGLKYYRVTGYTDDKKAYEPDMAYEKTVSHGIHFHGERVKQIEKLQPVMDRLPMVVSPYDAELFGHWWYEGQDFLYNVFVEMDKQQLIKAVTPMEYLHMYPQNQIITPCPSTWGADGYYDVWLNEKNAWIYRHLHTMADKIEQLANKYYFTKDELTERVLNQMLRELLLGQSSDWAFLITMGTAVEYSTKRTKEHIYNFNNLLAGFLANNTDMRLLEWNEYKNSIFEKIDFRVFASKYVD